MSVIILNEPKEIEVTRATNLLLGTWFLDSDDQIFVLALDDRTNEKRIVSLGHGCRPYITDSPIYSIKVKRTLLPGAVLQIANRFDKEAGYE